MNLLLFDKNKLKEDDSLLLEGAAFRHIREVIRAKPGQRIRVGAIDGNCGTARLASLHQNTAHLDNIELTQPGGKLLDADLVLALPRPKMARRVIESAVQIGFRSIHLINSWKVDKSFWQSKYLQPTALRETLIRGAEQAAVTCLPGIHLHPRFKPFVEDQLPAMLEGRMGLVGHPDSDQVCPVGIGEPSLLAVGPEGGFTPYELEMFARAGMKSVSLGGRILRVETALPLLSGRLYTSQST